MQPATLQQQLLLFNSFPTMLPASCACCQNLKNRERVKNPKPHQTKTQLCAFLSESTGVPGHPAKPQGKYLHATEMKQLQTKLCEDNPIFCFCLVEMNGKKKKRKELQLWVFMMIEWELSPPSQFWTASDAGSRRQGTVIRAA